MHKRLGRPGFPNLFDKALSLRAWTERTAVICIVTRNPKVIGGSRPLKRVNLRLADPRTPAFCPNRALIFSLGCTYDAKDAILKDYGTIIRRHARCLRIVSMQQYCKKAMLLPILQPRALYHIIGDSNINIIINDHKFLLLSLKSISAP